MATTDEREQELEREFLRASETKRGVPMFEGDRAEVTAKLRELEAKEGGAPLRSLHED